MNKSQILDFIRSISLLYVDWLKKRYPNLVCCLKASTLLGSFLWPIVDPTIQISITLGDISFCRGNGKPVHAWLNIDEYMLDPTLGQYKGLNNAIDDTKIHVSKKTMENNIYSHRQISKNFLEVPILAFAFEFHEKHPNISTEKRFEIYLNAVEENTNF